MQLRRVAQQTSEPHTEINPTAIDFPIISSDSESIQTNDGIQVSMEDHLLYDIKRKYSSNIFNLIFLILVLNLIIINRNKVYRHENAFLLCRFCLTFIA